MVVMGGGVVARGVLVVVTGDGVEGIVTVVVRSGVATGICAVVEVKGIAVVRSVVFIEVRDADTVESLEVVLHANRAERSKKPDVAMRKG